MNTKCPEDWFGSMNVFVSHWWGYMTKDLVSYNHLDSTNGGRRGSPVRVCMTGKVMTIAF